MRLNTRSSVDLPQPEGPMIAVTCRSGTVSEIDFSARNEVSDDVLAVDPPARTGFFQFFCPNQRKTLGDHPRRTEIFSKYFNTFRDETSLFLKLPPSRTLNLVLSVTDQGLGIPADALPRLFERFYRVDNSDRREIRGTGLGLAIVRAILDKSGGALRVASEPGRGSVFTVRLTASPDPRETESAHDNP